MAIKDEYDRLDALVELAPGLSEELLWQVLEVVPAIRDEADRAGVLAELAPALAHSHAQIERALDLVQELEEEEYRALALAGLSSYLSEDQQGRVLQLVLPLDMVDNSRSLCNSPLADFFVSGQSGQACLTLQ